MVAPLVKALGALVVGAPVAVVLGLTARSVSKQQDAAVPVIKAEQSPVDANVYSHYLDKRTHQPLSPKSFKKGYVAYDLRVENLSGRTVRGVHVELLDTAREPIGSVRVGDLAPHAVDVLRVKKAWTRVLEQHRVTTSSTQTAPEAVLTWRTPTGRRRAVTRLSATRVLGKAPADVKRIERQKAPLTAPIMA